MAPRGPGSGAGRAGPRRRWWRAATHAGCPGHAAYLRDNGSWDGTVDITPVYVCTDWRKQGHQLRMGTPISGLGTGSDGAMSGPMSGPMKAPTSPPCTP